MAPALHSDQNGHIKHIIPPEVKKMTEMWELWYLKKVLEKHKFNANKENSKHYKQSKIPQIAEFRSFCLNFLVWLQPFELSSFMLISCLPVTSFEFHKPYISANGFKNNHLFTTENMIFENYSNNIWYEINLTDIRPRQTVKLLKTPL